MPDETLLQQPLILFDGVCNFCNNSINYIIDKDKKAVFTFASLQSKVGKSLVHRHQLTDIDSIILIYNGKAYTKSSAVLTIAKLLGGIHVLAYGLVLIPKFIRDACYSLIARNRYLWFGKKEQCMLPSPAIRQRFID